MHFSFTSQQLLSFSTGALTFCTSINEENGHCLPEQDRCCKISRCDAYRKKNRLSCEGVGVVADDLGQTSGDQGTPSDDDIGTSGDDIGTPVDIYFWNFTKVVRL